MAGPDIIDITAPAPPVTLEEGGAPIPAPSVEAESEFDIAAVAAVDDFLNVFGETIIYYPIAGSSREIKAIIERKEIEDIDGFSDVNSPLAVMKVANDSTKGIASFEIDRGGDEIKYSYMLGKTAQRRRITRVLSIDYAWLKLEVR